MLILHDNKNTDMNERRNKPYQCNWTGYLGGSLLCFGLEFLLSSQPI